MSAIDMDPTAGQSEADNAGPPLVQALLDQVLLATGAQAVALGAAGPAGTLQVIQAAGVGFVPGGLLQPASRPDLRILPVSLTAAGQPVSGRHLLLLGGRADPAPGSGLAAGLLGLAAVLSLTTPAPAAQPAAPDAMAPVPNIAPGAGSGFDAGPVQGTMTLRQRSVNRVCELLDADLASVAVRGGDGEFYWWALTGYRSQVVGPVPPQATLVFQVIETGHSWSISIPEGDKEELRARFPLLVAEDVQTVVGVPLTVDDRPVGALLIGWRRPYRVTEAEQRLVQALADQVVGAVLQTQMYEETRRQSHFLERLIQHVPAGIVAFSLPEFRVREVNRFYLQFLDEPFRSSAADLHGRQLREFVPQADETGIQAIFEQVAATDEPFTIADFEYHGFSRGVTYWDWSLVPLHDSAAGPVSGVLLVMVERTEQVLARRRLAAALEAARNQATELETIIQQMVEGVAISDSAGNLTKINPAGVAMLGRGVIPLEPGVDYAERYQIYWPDGRVYAAEDLPLHRACQGETVLGQDLLVRQPDGRERIISVSAAPLFSEGQEITGAVAVFHDVTKAREVERVKDEFLAIVSHELRTPLAAILGYTDLMLRGLHGPLTEKGRHNQQAIRNNATRLLGLINDLLDVSKLEAHSVALNPAPIQLHDLIPKAVAWVQVLATGRGVAVSYRVPRDLPAIWGDEDRLHQVLTNLLSNAIKFTPAGGTVVVQAQVSRLAPDAPPGTTPDEEAGPPASLLVSVHDTGIGLQAEQLARIWDRFYQADSTSSRRYGGTGLGLTIVKNLIALHGGVVWADSAGTGQGSTFHFRLPPAPVAEGAGGDPGGAESPPLTAPAPAAPPAPAGNQPGAGPLILLIEDHPDLAAITQTMLEGEGYRVALARDGLTGLELAAQLQPAAILLDVLLPQANGWEVLERLRGNPATAAIPVVILSILEHQRLGLVLGATEYLVKPFDREQFTQTLHRLVRRPPTEPAILVVDDEPAVRDLLSTVLETEGYGVQTAADGVAAVEQITAQPPAVLLLDLMMPRLDGFGVLEWVRTHPNPAVRQIPVVLLTAKDLSAEERARLQTATVSLISKAGLTIDDLLTTVRETLQDLHVAPHHDPAGSPR